MGVVGRGERGRDGRLEMVLTIHRSKSHIDWGPRLEFVQLGFLAIEHELGVF